MASITPYLRCRWQKLGRHPCHCTGFEADEDDETICEACEHSSSWHRSPVELTQDELSASTAEGREPLERCSDTLEGLGQGNPDERCPCPVFVVGEGRGCRNCGHKKTWHNAKRRLGAQAVEDAGGQQQVASQPLLPPPSPRTMSSSSTSTFYSTSPSAFGSAPIPIDGPSSSSAGPSSPSPGHGAGPSNREMEQLASSPTPTTTTAASSTYNHSRSGSGITATAANASPRGSEVPALNWNANNTTSIGSQLHQSPTGTNNPGNVASYPVASGSASATGVGIGSSAQYSPVRTSGAAAAGPSSGGGGESVEPHYPYPGSRLRYTPSQVSGSLSITQGQEISLHNPHLFRSPIFKYEHKSDNFDIALIPSQARGHIFQPGQTVIVVVRLRNDAKYDFTEFNSLSVIFTGSTGIGHQSHDFLKMARAIPTSNKGKGTSRTTNDQSMSSSPDDEVIQMESSTAAWKMAFRIPFKTGCGHSPVGEDSFETPPSYISSTSQGLNVKYKIEFLGERGKRMFKPNHDRCYITLLDFSRPDWGLEPLAHDRVGLSHEGLWTVEKITPPIPMPRPHCVLTSGEVRHYVSRSPRSDSTPKAARYLYINYHITITGVYSSHLLQLFESLQVNIFRTGYQSPAPTTNGSGGRGSSASPTDFVKMDSPDPVLLLGREDEPVRIERVGGEGYGTANGLRLEMRGRLEVDREKVKMVRICNAEIRYRLEVRPRRVGGADKDRGKARETTESPVFGGNIWSLLPVDDPDSFPSSSGHEVASSSSYSHWTNDNPGPSQSSLVREQYIASTLLDSGANRSSDFPSGPSTSTSTSTPQNGEVIQDSRRSGSGYSLPFSIPNRPSSSSSSSVPAGNSNSSSTSFSSPSASNVGSSSSIPADEATISSASSTVTGTTVNANNRDRSSSSSGAPRAHPIRSEGSGSSGGVTGNWAASTLGRLTDTLDNWRTAESYVPNTSRPLATSSTAAAAVASSPSTSTSRPGFPTNVSSSSNDPERDWFNSVIEADDPPPPTFDGAGRWAHEDDPDNPDAGDEQLPEYERAFAEELRRIQEGEEP